MSQVSKVVLSDLVSFVSDKPFDTLKPLLNEQSLHIKIKKGEKENTQDPQGNLYLVALDKSVEQDYSKSDSENLEKHVTEFTPLMRQGNGIIFEKNTNKIVSVNNNKIYSLDKLSDLQSVLEKRGIKETLLTTNNKDIRVEFCEDGTVMRLYNYQDKWYTATTRCLDARMSYWSSNKTFDAMFWEVFDKACLAKLDPAYTYIFVLLHRDNRIVVSHKRNSLVYISRIHNVSLDEDFGNIFYGISCNIRRPKVMPMLNINNKLVLNPYKRGIIVKLFNKDTNSWDIYKIDFEEYSTIKSIRGNVCHIRMRFLELLSEPDTLSLLEKYYPEHSFLFAMIRNSLGGLTREIHKLYVDSHIKHSVQVAETNVYYKTLKQLHGQYKRTNKPIDYDDVTAKLYSLDKNVLRRFLGWV